MGGSDPNNLTEHIVKSLKEFNNVDFNSAKIKEARVSQMLSSANEDFFSNYFKTNLLR